MEKTKQMLYNKSQDRIPVGSSLKKMIKSTRSFTDTYAYEQI